MKAQLVRSVLVNLAVASFAIATLYPILWVLKIALSPGASGVDGALPIPTVVSLEHFETVVGVSGPQSNGLFLRQLGNSLIVASVSALVGLSVATTAAYALSRWRFWGQGEMLSLFMVSQMFPGILMSIPLYLLLFRLNLLDSWVGLVLVYSSTSVPFSVWNLKGYFDTIPRELEEAAMIDGASRLTAFYRIILPLSTPAIAVTGLFSFLTAWNEFALAATVLSAPEALTLPVVLQRYVGEHQANWGAFAAGSVIVSVPVIVLFFYLQRYFVSGLTAGAVKG